MAGAGVWTINYVGSRGRNIDYAPVGKHCNDSRPRPCWPSHSLPLHATVLFFDQPIGGDSSPDALETSLQGRSRVTGLSYLVSYTWSKGLNFGTDGWYGIGTTSVRDAYNPRAIEASPAMICRMYLPPAGCGQIHRKGWFFHRAIRNRSTCWVIGRLPEFATLKIQPSVFTVYDAGDVPTLVILTSWGGATSVQIR